MRFNIWFCFVIKFTNKIYIKVYNYAVKKLQCSNTFKLLQFIADY